MAADHWRPFERRDDVGVVNQGNSRKISLAGSANEFRDAPIIIPE